MKKLFIFIVLFALGVSAKVNNPVCGPGRTGDLDDSKHIHIPHGVMTSSWDTRLIIRVKYKGNNDRYSWDAFLFKPESMKRTQNGLPDLVSNNSFSPSVEIDSDSTTGDLNAPENRLRADKRMHLAIYPNPELKKNPYPSNQDGSPTSNMRSRYETYNFYIVGVVNESHDTVNEFDKNFLVFSKAQVVVQDPYTSRARIHSAKILQQGQTIRDENNEMIYAMEPSVTMDGRLMVYNGHPVNRGNGFVMYTFNPNPGSATGWSSPRPLSDLFWVHGAGSQNEMLVDGVLFSKRYPIAAIALRDSSNRVFRMGEALPGAYPWISFDGTEALWSSVATFNGPRRAGSVVAGELTNYMVQHIDGRINPMRSNLTDRSDLFPSIHPEGQELVDKYNAHTDQYGQAFGRHAWERILSIPLGLYSSMWNPYVKKFDNHLPIVDRDHVYSFIMSHSKRYVEVPLWQVKDGHYIYYYPMNEDLQYDLPAIQRQMQSHTKDWNAVYSVVQQDPRRTPDVSGNFKAATLQGGAQFPFERNDAKAAWQSDRVILDRNEGIVGNAIYFTGNSRLDTQVGQDELRNMIENQEMSFEFWVKPLTSDSKLQTITYIKDFFYTALYDHKLFVKWTFADQSIQFTVGNNYQVNQWNHYLISFKKGNMRVYQNSVLVHEQTTNEKLSQSQITEYRSWIGPNASDSNTYYMLDEVALSDVARTQKEACMAALHPSDKSKPHDYLDFSGDDDPVSEGLVQRASKELGQKLFFDPTLSRDRSVSCASCHNPDLAWTDGRRFAVGIGRQIIKSNTPTIFNRLFGRLHNWDGKAESLEAQALIPIENPKEMNMTMPEVVQRLKQNQSYVELFHNAYQSEITADLVLKALADFQRNEISPRTSFDRKSLSEIEQNGMGLFYGKARCAMCHTGTNFTDEKFHHNGFGKGQPHQFGRANVTSRRWDKGKFKTPTLRKVASTAPYFHDGRFENLGQVIDFYNQGGSQNNEQDIFIQPLGLTEQEKVELEAFLQAIGK